jgi:dTDP-glucose 4,6-dehydratase
VNIAHLEGVDNFTLRKADVTRPIDSDEPLDYVLNLASPASPVDYLRHPIETLQVGSLGTHHLLELARSHNAVFLQASTSEVYGDPEISPQTEEYWGHVNPIGPRSVYDEAKRFGEALTMAYHRQYGLAVRIARIFNVYGPRMRPNDGRAVPNFISQALANKPLTVYGDGSQTRSFCYVLDEVNGLYRLLTSEVVGPINIGHPGTETPIIEVAEIIRRLTGSQSEIVFEDAPDDDPKQRRPDIAKATELLGWVPTTGFEEGLTATIDYFRAITPASH